MAHVYYVLGAILLWGIVQADIIRKISEPAIIEDLRSQSTRIVGGWPAKEHQFPFQISLRMISAVGGVSSCGGSVIHHKWIITAAHCVANRISFVIRLGVTNVTHPQYLVDTNHKFIHPLYDEIRAGVQTDDIALLGLNQEIPYGASVQPCRLQNSQQKNIDYKGVVLTVSGFGRTDDLWNGGAASDILRWTHLRGITNEECLSWYPGSQVIQDQTVCAEFYNDTAQSSCQGDSGGPLTVEDLDGKPTMIGVVSFGSSAGCNGPHPSAYVRPGHYHDWFTEVTGINFDWTNEDLEDSLTAQPSDNIIVVNA